MHRLTGLEVEPQEVNTSQSGGYAAEREAGRISDALANLIEADERVIAWDVIGAELTLAP